MTLGLTSSGAVKIKTDNGTTTAVECACCGICPTFPDICWNGGQFYPFILNKSNDCTYNYSYISDECNYPGFPITCYDVYIIKLTDTTWGLNAINFMGPSFGPFFFISEAIGTGTNIFEATWEIIFGFSEVPIETLISKPTNGIC